MRHTFFARPCNAAAKCAAGFACSAANTDNNSILLLTMTLYSQCRFLLYSAFWASHRQQNEPNRYSRDKHDLVYQESAPDRFGRGRFFVV